MTTTRILVFITSLLLSLAGTARCIAQTNNTPANPSAVAASRVGQEANSLQLQRIPNARPPRNIIFILTDDHRYDALGFLKAQTFIRTPNLDRMAAAGAHLPNAFVTTALCSPSRASILTGLYAHKHRVVDNNNPVPADLVFYPQYLQHAGYETAMIGKWHMGGET
ncbi:MAG: sulfatase-like hydrolase/transferase, partial [Acidobacteriota bacterium]|nr:sulfatase-like hydrolase/transferase [Acidobacteriota bacterium]